MINLKKTFRKSVTIKLIAICLVTVVLLYPKYKIEGVIADRQNNKLIAETEVSKMWGNSQIIQSPIVIIPYWHYFINNNEEQKVKRKAMFLPENLNIAGIIKPEQLSRGIFKVAVYQTDLEISGDFSRPDFGKLGIGETEVIWEEAYISVSVTDKRGIKENIILNWQSQEVKFISGINPSSISAPDLIAHIDFKEDKNIFRYNYKVRLKGSKSISFLPLANQTNVKIKSSWNSPSFKGEYVTDNKLINDEGFQAEWNVLSLNRTYPQEWAHNTPDILQSSFGVELFQPADQYQQATRSAKYALLIIFLTFLTYFLIESLMNVSVHPIQYGMVGLGLIIFYTLLISMSEYMQFYYAYLVASSMMTITLGLYSASVFRNWVKGGLVAFFILLLYVFVFMMIQSEDYSMLIGSFGLWVVLILAMYFTRKIDWYNHRVTEGFEASLEEA